MVQFGIGLPYKRKVEHVFDTRNIIPLTSRSRTLPETYIYSPLPSEAIESPAGIYDTTFSFISPFDMQYLRLLSLLRRMGLALSILSPWNLLVQGGSLRRPALKDRRYPRAG